jgi:hypothetical protein
MSYNFGCENVNSQGVIQTEKWLSSCSAAQLRVSSFECRAEKWLSSCSEMWLSSFEQNVAVQLRAQLRAQDIRVGGK